MKICPLNLKFYFVIREVRELINIFNSLKAQAKRDNLRLPNLNRAILSSVKIIFLFNVIYKLFAYWCATFKPHTYNKEIPWSQRLNGILKSEVEVTLQLVLEVRHGHVWSPIQWTSKILLLIVILDSVSPNVLYVVIYIKLQNFSTDRFI